VIDPERSWPAGALLGSGSGLSLGIVDVGGVGKYEVPAISAVLASIGHDVARKPETVLTRVGDQKTSTSTIDANDFVLWFHEFSLPDVRGVSIFRSVR
jgi:hypothetical protein